MQTFLFLLNLPDPSPRELVITAAVSLGWLVLFLRHKFG